MAIVEVDKLVKRYKGAQTNAVDGISFSLEPGEFFAMLAPTAGSVRVGGHDVVREARAEENVRMHTILYGLYAFRPTFSLMPIAYRDQVHWSGFARAVA